MPNKERIGVRFTPKESEVFGEVVRRAWERTKGYATYSDIAKELMRMRPLNILTEKDLTYVEHSCKSENPNPNKYDGKNSRLQ